MLHYKKWIEGIMEPFTLTNKEYFTISSWITENQGLIAGFTTKNGGFSQNDFAELNFGFHVGDDRKTVRQNRSLFSKKIDFPLINWVGAEQTHGVSIQKVVNSDRGKGSDVYETSFSDTDGFLTDEKGVLLTLCFADCVPIYFLDPEKRRIGLAHAGWKGSVGGIAKEIMSLFVQNGSNLKNILAVIGPCICKKCYIVDNRVISLVEKVLDDVEEKPYNQISNGQYSLDLKRLNKQILMGAGLDEANIFVTEYCTSCNSEYFYSHRRDHGTTGRMMAFIGLKEGFHP
jgi:polyphenol oxidase